jgi:hypothetical protein
LIAREIESRGIPTISMSSAYSITAAVNPPRAVYLDFPLGHTAGKPHDAALQRRVLRDTLDALVTIDTPGTIRRLPYRWTEDDSWKDLVMRPGAGGSSEDDRTRRLPDPQYQCEEDRIAAQAAFERDGCPSCVFLG